MQFIRASVAAIRGAYRSMPWPEATGYILFGAIGLIRLIGTKKVSNVELDARMSACVKCPVYNDKLKTCGTPGLLDIGADPVGCWCFIPIVSRYQKKGCYMRSSMHPQRDQHGWKS